MKKIVALFAVLAIAIATHADELPSDTTPSPDYLKMEDNYVNMFMVSDALADELEKTVKDLPDTVQPECPNKPELQFVIDAMGDDSIVSIFRDKRAASEVFSDWYNRTGSYDTTHKAWRDDVKLIANELQKLTGADKDFSFVRAVTRRAWGNFKVPGNGVAEALDRLEKSGFPLPLFSKAGNAHKRIQALNDLFESERVVDGMGVGGFGQYSLKRLFTTPADGYRFSVAQVERLREAQETGVLPLPSLDCPRILEEDGDKAAAAGTVHLASSGPNLCCCNTSGHNMFRKCTAMTGPSCNTCGGTYCCLAGVQWCPPHAPE